MEEVWAKGIIDAFDYDWQYCFGTIVTILSNGLINIGDVEKEWHTNYIYCKIFTCKQSQKSNYFRKNNRGWQVDLWNNVATKIIFHTVKRYTFICVWNWNVFVVFSYFSWRNSKSDTKLVCWHEKSCKLQISKFS